MKKQIIHVSVLQSSKVLAIVGCLISALISIPFGVYALVKNDNTVAMELFLQPLIHLVLGFITAVIVFLIYNQLTKLIGGIEVSLEDKDVTTL